MIIGARVSETRHVSNEVFKSVPACRSTACRFPPWPVNVTAAKHSANLLKYMITVSSPHSLAAGSRVCAVRRTPFFSFIPAGFLTRAAAPRVTASRRMRRWCRGHVCKKAEKERVIYRHEARSAHGAYNVSVGPFVIPDLRSDKISIYKCPTPAAISKTEG